VQPWQQAARRANKLRQRLDTVGRSLMAGRPPQQKRLQQKQKQAALVEDYKRLLDAVLLAEIQTTEAGTARLLQLADAIKPQFEL
jgi:hypothetical protein